MLSRKLQSKNKSGTAIGIDVMLDEFEPISKRDGDVHGLAMIPLAYIYSSATLNGLGWRTTPYPRLNFSKRNIYFICVARSKAKGTVNIDVMKILATLVLYEPNGDFVVP